jgi:hypothetical protein
MSTTPVDLAQRQLDAYNAGDVEAFVLCYSEDVVAARHPSGEVICSGREALRRNYGDLFTRRPRLHAELLARIPCGTFVVDHERVTDEPGAPPRFAVAIYRCGPETIEAVWFLPVVGAERFGVGVPDFRAVFE